MERFPNAAFPTYALLSCMSFGCRKVGVNYAAAGRDSANGCGRQQVPGSPAHKWVKKRLQQAPRDSVEAAYFCNDQLASILEAERRTKLIGDGARLCSLPSCVHGCIDVYLAIFFCCSIPSSPRFYGAGVPFSVPFSHPHVPGPCRPHTLEKPGKTDCSAQNDSHRKAACISCSSAMLNTLAPFRAEGTNDEAHRRDNHRRQPTASNTLTSNQHPPANDALYSK